MCDEWLKDLKKGDPVYVKNTYMYDTFTLSIVGETTPNGCIRINNTLYTNGNFYSPGSGNRLELVQYTPEFEAKLKAEAHYNHICYSINAQDMRGKPLDQVQRIYDILKED